MRWLTAFLLLVALLTTSIPAPGQEEAAPRSAAEILRDIRSVGMPSHSAGANPEARQRFVDAINAGCRRKGELALELYRAHPEHSQVPSVLSTRWAGMNNALGEGSAVLDEVNALLEVETRPAIRREALLAAMRACTVLDEIPVETKLAMIEAAIEVAPEREHCGLALLDVAKYHASDPDRMKKIARRVLEQWPDSKWAAVPARSLLKLLDRVGAPFTCSFEDVLSGATMDTAEWKGRPLLFFVWSGSLVSDRIRKELDGLAALAARRPDLRVVGVFNWRFEGGPAALKVKLEELAIDWPHAYAGEEMESPWSGRWAVREVPCYFLVDREGLLTGVSHRVAAIDQRLEQIEKKRPARLLR